MIADKIITREAAAAAARALREAGRRLVFTNGCFDLLHRGHVRYLEMARQLGDALLVAINGDVSVRALKGPGRPLNGQQDRAAVVAALASVDYVVVFEEVRTTQLLLEIRPAIYVKGGDYSPETLHSEERAALQTIGAEIRIVPFEKGYSTSALIERMQSEVK